MPVIDFLERNVKLYGNETALVELHADERKQPYRPEEGRQGGHSDV